MPPTVANIQAVIGEDIYEPYVAESSVDVSDWTSWVVEAYVYDQSGALRATCKAATGTVVKTDTGKLYSWLKSAVTMALPRGAYTIQTWRIDAGHEFVLRTGTLKLLPFAPPV
jgi:hypothetical protein